MNLVQHGIYSIVTYTAYGFEDNAGKVSLIYDMLGVFFYFGALSQGLNNIPQSNSSPNKYNKAHFLLFGIVANGQKIQLVGNAGFIKGQQC